eukprot:CAMPEP_0206185504 /NCGR_PEP_ID=MMETSP0166-20121206/1850_1 /ASSEMBLY_ACC=CAM_ASM_000260 /TAXON_ID=95228 /ORGANISM="Vannella robusta, Strain DIVA3 518/3/11/1/6" /LENGTH=648 /DNA_ID=CAMNT_0053600717 /DNA_START=234 /DNA_END=2180 /DNA_ORIENTATION=-
MIPNIKEFCAGAFRDLRENLYLVSTEDYIDEWNLTEDQLSATEGAGRSGSLFCFSRTKKFIFKTIFRSEVDSLISMIKKYHKYCHQQPDTLIMRMMGLYCFSRDSVAANFTYVLVFGNVMWSGIEKPLKIHQVFDLKGRRTKTLRFHQEEEEEPLMGVQKDKHLERLFYTENYRRQLVQQLAADVNLLKDHNLMDYSLLIGIHHCEEDEEIEPTPTHPSCMGSSQFRLYKGGFPANGEIYYIGIIDCLTYYGAMKKIAHSFKSLLWNKEQLSTVQAQFYATRFLKYVNAIFPAGEQPSVSPFTPCAATNEEENLTVLLQSIRGVLIKNTAASSSLSEEEFTAQPVHTIAMPSQNGDAISVSIKEYAPAIFAKLRQEWNRNPQEIGDDLLVPLLQLQANRVNIFAENGSITGTSIPSVSKKYTVETVPQRDAHTFFAFISTYTKYMLQNPDTYICKVVGVYRCSFGLLSRMYVIVMENPEYTSESLPMIATRVYSLQGVKFKQPVPALKDTGAKSRPAIFFDRNLDRTFCMGSQRDELLTIIRRDVEFLKANAMIGYSMVLVVGSLVIPEGEHVDTALVQKEKRGLVESAFGQWVLLAGIYDVWRRYGKREIVSSSISALRGSVQESTVTDPVFYAERFIDSLEARVTK